MPPFSVTAGAPYSGQQVDVNVQTLADGSTISNATGFQQKAWRDSQGRVRVERSVIAGRGSSRLKNVPILVSIQDPVAGFAYILDDQTRVVHRIPLATVASRVQASVSGNLGTQVIDGIEANGNRTTMVVPANTRGNSDPITVTRDEWVSPELNLAILVVTTNPAQGVATSKISNLTRIAPDPTLFQIPLDYTLVDEKQTFTIQWVGN
jgi:hypothetical protein